VPQAITPLDAVHLIARTLSSNLDSDEAMRRTLEVAVEVTAAEGGSILCHDREQACLRFRHVVGDSSATACRIRRVWSVAFAPW
jgi:hypothetical protein